MTTPRYTKQHYDEIAMVVYLSTWGDQNKQISETFAEIFKKDNPRFDAMRWFEASKHKKMER